jgi:hypothetical protein
MSSAINEDIFWIAYFDSITILYRINTKICHEIFSYRTSYFMENVSNVEIQIFENLAK